jgi:hypothetical protein
MPHHGCAAGSGDLSGFIGRSVIDNDGHYAHATDGCRYARQDVAQYAGFVMRRHNYGNQAIVSPLA